MAMALGTLEYVLEEGSRWNWFDDATIRDCAMIAGVAGFLFVIRSLTFPRPSSTSARSETGTSPSAACSRSLPASAFFPPSISPRCFWATCRIQRLADGHGHFLDRISVARRRADLCHAREKIRHALAHDDRARVLRSVDVELQLHHP